MNKEQMRKLAADLKDMAGHIKMQKTANKLDSRQVYNFLKFFGKRL